MIANNLPQSPQQTIEYWILMKNRNPRQYAAHCPPSLQKQVEAMEQRQQAAKPTPPRKGSRAAMTTPEKSAYITQHGRAEYLNLPAK